MGFLLPYVCNNNENHEEQIFQKQCKFTCTEILDTECKELQDTSSHKLANPLRVFFVYFMRSVSLKLMRRIYEQHATLASSLPYNCLCMISRIFYSSLTSVIFWAKN